MITRECKARTRTIEFVVVRCYDHEFLEVGEGLFDLCDDERDSPAGKYNGMNGEIEECLSKSRFRDR